MFVFPLLRKETERKNNGQEYEQKAEFKPRKQFVLKFSPGGNMDLKGVAYCILMDT